MAGKKKEGIDALKEISGGKRREDRNASGKTYFNPFSVDAKNALTVIYLLQSPEEDILLRAVVSLEAFARKDPENVKFLCSLGISQYLFPLINNQDFIVRRFTLKLIGMLSKLEEFREQLLKMENVLETFNSILNLDSDVLLQEFSSLTLANLSSDYTVASNLLKVESCIDTLFTRVHSLDPDVEKNCLEIMNHLLDDVNGIEAFVVSSKFEVKAILDLIFSSYPEIQNLALEVLLQLTSWSRDNTVLLAFRDASGVDQTLTILEKEEWSDLHLAATELLLNVTENAEICEYLQQSGCLYRLVCLLDNMTKKTQLEKMLGVLARMSQSSKARSALHSVEIEKRFITYLEESSDYIQEASCLGLANQSQYFPSLDSIISENPIKSLMAILNSPEKSSSVKNTAAYTLSILSNADQRVAEILTQPENLESLVSVLANHAHLPTELCQNIIQVFMGISSNQRFRLLAITEKFFSTLISCLPSSTDVVMKDVSLQVDTLECLSGFLVESEARELYNRLNGAETTLNCLRSKFASVREWAGHLVVIASQNQEFIKSFVKKNGLQWMLKEKNTMHSMPSWQSAIETIFSNFLPAKFAYTGRLDFQDITKDGFYISVQPNARFFVIEYFFEEQVSPIFPIYVANFNTPMKLHVEKSIKFLSGSQISVQEANEPQNQEKYIKEADVKSLEEDDLQKSINTYSSVDYDSRKIEQEPSIHIEDFFPDMYLRKHLENLKKKIAKEEICIEDSNWCSVYRNIICERARVIAQFVAEEMSGPEADPTCSAQHKITQINEMKHFLGSNIIPLGLVRMGDYLERAMLFKVLADRIGFSCALVRGSYGRAWIEIAIPVINVEDIQEETLEQPETQSIETQSSCQTSSTNSSDFLSQNSSEIRSPEVTQESDFWFPKLKLMNFKGFPKEYLKPNAIVDLINDPGKILNINSFEAKEYCGGFLFSQAHEKVESCTSL